MLHQIEVVLETMAEFQRMLEGEKYITGSLVPVAVFQVSRAACYVEVEAIESGHTYPFVKKLSKTLLKDFDKRYEPEDPNLGLIQYFREEDELGKFNCDKGIHQYYFFAALSDPRVASMLANII